MLAPLALPPYLIERSFPVHHSTALINFVVCSDNSLICPLVLIQTADITEPVAEERLTGWLTQFMVSNRFLIWYTAHICLLTFANICHTSFIDAGYLSLCYCTVKIHIGISRVPLRWLSFALPSTQLFNVYRKSQISFLINWLDTWRRIFFESNFSGLLSWLWDKSVSFCWEFIDFDSTVYLNVCQYLFKLFYR